MHVFERRRVDDVNGECIFQWVPEFSCLRTLLNSEIKISNEIHIIRGEIGHVTLPKTYSNSNFSTEGLM